MESRYLSDYSLGAMNNTFSGGVRLYRGTTYRRANGKGTTGKKYDATVIGNFPKDITYESNNAAVFIENIFRLTEKFLIVPGIRYEFLQAEASGRNGYTNTGSEIILQNQKRSRGFLLAGVGAEYHISTTELYGNYTQAYRPMQFADLTTPPTTDVVDVNLNDAKGYNIDFGYRGKVKNFLQFDVSTFYLQYNNRIGVIAQQRQDGSFYNFRTNVGNSTSKGIESYIQFNPARAFTTSTNADLILFTSYGYTDAHYGNLKVVTKQGNSLVESNLKDKKVENAPEHILRTGITAGYKGLLLTGQLSYVSEAFADANNTITPTANAQNGLIPSYTITDLTATYKFSKALNIKAGINNLFDERYFTRRAGGYPGPGLLPADGRSFFVSVGAEF
jgi:Fe(3+) dicitrate transport protein